MIMELNANCQQFVVMQNMYSDGGRCSDRHMVQMQMYVHKPPAVCSEHWFV